MLLTLKTGLKDMSELQYFLNFRVKEESFDKNGNSFS
jgi:hypothetical protein